MNKKALIALLALVLISISVPSRADRYNRSQGDNPFKLIAYVLNPIGLVAEYVVMRPIHWMVSQPCADITFGHQVEPEDAGKYFEWTHGDYSPSIVEEKAGKNGKK